MSREARIIESLAFRQARFRHLPRERLCASGPGLKHFI